jgi:hypothetical protein
MKVTGRVARKQFNREGEYNMDYFTVELSTEDLPDEFRKEVSVTQLFRVLEFMVQRELLSIEMQSGHMALDYAQGRMEYLRRCLGEELSNKLYAFGI